MLNNNIEIWKTIPNYENFYEVSNTGKIRTLRTKKILKTYIINSGYECIKFCVNNTRTSHLIHRLVMLTFYPIENSDTLTVNHKNGNRLDNTLSNLEWATISQNIKHSYDELNRDKELCKSYIGLKHANSKTKYHNVGYDKSRNKFYGKVVHNTKVYEFKRFNTEIEAALHVNYIIDKYQLDRPKNIIEMPNDYPIGE